MTGSHFEAVFILTYTSGIPLFRLPEAKLPISFNTVKGNPLFVAGLLRICSFSFPYALLRSKQNDIHPIDLNFTIRWLPVINNWRARCQHKSQGHGRIFMIGRQGKSTELFKKVIEQKLDEMAKDDELFARNLLKPKKNIDDCASYIINQVKQSGVCGLTDDEVFGMAAHYYDEDEIEVGTSVKCDIVMNHTVELTGEEILEAKKGAKAEIHHFEKIRLTRDAEKEFKAGLIKQQRDKLSNEELAQAQSEAKQQVIDEERQRLTRKPAKVRMAVVKNNQEKVVATQKSMF